MIRYLGVKFSSSCTFLSMSRNAVRKAKMASGSVLSILARSKCSSWDARAHLFNTIAKSTLFNCIAVWSLKYLDALERVQLGFFKRLLMIPNNTADYLVL